MSREYLVHLGKRYSPMAPGSVYETMVQALVEKNADALFPTFDCRKIAPYFRTAAGDVRPDLVLIGRDHPMWAVVEVEAQEHSATAHVKPQLAKLHFARADGVARQEILSSFVGIEAGHLEEALSGEPLVYLVTHGSTPVPSSDLQTLAIRSIELSIYRAGANDYILKVDDRSDSLVRVPGGAKRMDSPMLRGIWTLVTNPLSDLDELGDKVPVDFDGIRSVWGCTRTGDGYLLRMPTALAEEIEATYAVAFLDTEEVVLVMHADAKGTPV